MEEKRLNFGRLFRFGKLYLQYPEKFTKLPKFGKLLSNETQVKFPQLALERVCKTSKSLANFGAW